MFTYEEIDSLTRLIRGQREPLPGMERHFIMVMKGLARPCSPKERGWYEYWRSSGRDSTEAPAGWKFRYKSAIEAVRDREATIGVLEQHVENLKNEARKISELFQLKDQSNERLKREIAQLETFLKNAHETLEKYEPAKRLREAIEQPTERGLLYECQACARPIDFCICGR